MTIRTILFERQPWRESLGRNGYIQTTGVEIFEQYTPPDGGDRDGVILLSPITSKGKPSDSCRVALARSALPQIIAALQAIVDEEGLYHMTTRSQAVAADIAALLRARNPLIWISSGEEARVEGYLVEVAASANYIPRMWDCGQGVTDMAGRVLKDMGGVDPADPGSMLRFIAERAKKEDADRGVWIMRDLPPWLAGPIGMTTLRQVRNLARTLPGVPQDHAQALVVLAPASPVPPEVAGHATAIEWPLPDRDEMGGILDASLKPVANNKKVTLPSNGEREAAIDAAIGLSGEEAQACYARSLVSRYRIDAGLVANEKKRVIARERVLEWIEPIPGGLQAVGGLDVLKAWLLSRGAAYSPAFRAYAPNLAPKGALLAGVSGCGKTLIAKAIATAWGVPLLRLDFGALKDMYVGKSEGNLRKAHRTIEAIGRCVVLIDEVEKTSLTSSAQGAADGGVSSDFLGYTLSWMQDRPGGAFLVATCNDATKLPAELMRPGRFDKCWFIDLPTPRERAEILKAALRTHGRGAVDVDCDIAQGFAQDFTGAEIAALVPDALYAAFAEGAREITTDDLIEAARIASGSTVAKRSAKTIEAQREWAAAGGAQRATSAERATTTRTEAGRQLDL